jgi:membrane fusion protein, multidrug efflux system
MKYYDKFVWHLVIFASILCISGCGSKDESGKTSKNGDAGKAEVVVAKVVKGPIFKSYTAMGAIVAVDVARILPKVAGRVVKIYATEGSEVRAGQTLMQLTDFEYKLAVQGYQAAAKMAEVGEAKSERDLSRAESLHKEEAIAEQTYQDAKSQVEANKYQVQQLQAQADLQRKNVGECRVVSPISGIVTSKFVNEGELTGPQSPAPPFVVENMLKVKLEVDLTEDAFGYLEAGSKCLVTVDAIPDKSFEGTISKIYPSINAISKTFKVTIIIDNPDLKLRSGMTARAQVVQKTRDDAITAPKVAFLPGEEGFYVFKIYGGKVIRTPVKIGIEGNDTYEVLQGLVPGDYVAVEGQVGLSDGLAVKAILQTPNKPKYTQAPAPVKNESATIQQQKSPTALPVSK